MGDERSEMVDRAGTSLRRLDFKVDLRPRFADPAGHADRRLVSDEEPVRPARQRPLVLRGPNALLEPLRNQVFFRTAMVFGLDSAVSEGDQLMAASAELGRVFAGVGCANGAAGMAFQRHVISPRRPVSRQ